MVQIFCRAARQCGRAPALSAACSTSCKLCGGGPARSRPQELLDTCAPCSLQAEKWQQQKGAVNMHMRCAGRKEARCTPGGKLPCR